MANLRTIRTVVLNRFSPGIPNTKTKIELTLPNLIVYDVTFIFIVTTSLLEEYDGTIKISFPKIDCLSFRCLTVHYYTNLVSCSKIQMTIYISGKSYSCLPLRFSYSKRGSSNVSDTLKCLTSSYLVKTLFSVILKMLWLLLEYAIRLTLDDHSALTLF